MIARPKPVQDPIPIWIGGNSKLTRRRVAQRAQGWMPMMGSPEMSATARTPLLASLEEVATAVAEVRDAAEAQGRTDVIDVVYSYNPEGGLVEESDRRREELADIEQAGATWVVVSTDSTDHAETTEFLERFGSEHLSPDGQA